MENEEQSPVFSFRKSTLADKVYYTYYSAVDRARFTLPR